MKIKLSISALAICLTLSVQAQFHTMKIPQPSPKVVETQRLGITDITLDYSSPSVNGRDVWNEVINAYGDPNLAWRAGANLNTRISFSTDVTINGNPLKAGGYGIHIDKSEDGYIIMFAHHDNQWGSYYLDRDNHVTLRVKVQGEEAPFSEQLDYEFLNRTDSSLVVGLEWAEKRLPFTVAVNLKKTVIENFRYELLGINTYRWEAWNDAANWCLNHETNLEEALEWVDRSINGGYNGFASNKNITNMTTKARLLHKLNRRSDLIEIITEVSEMEMSAYQINQFSIFLLQSGNPESAEDLLKSAVAKFPDAWYLKLNRGITYYMRDNPKKALKELNSIKDITPENFQPRLGEIISEIQSGSYRLPGT